MCSPQRGIDESIPPLRGDSGGCAFLSFFDPFFTHSFIFRIDRHSTFMAPIEDENAVQKSISPFCKGVRGIWVFPAPSFRLCHNYQFFCTKIITKKSRRTLILQGFSPFLWYNSEVR